MKVTDTSGVTNAPPAGSSADELRLNDAPGVAFPGSPSGAPAGGTPPEKPPVLTDTQTIPELKLDTIKMPEGVKLEGEAKDAFAKAINEGDPNKRAQALLDLYAGEAKKAQEGAYKTFQDMNKQWVDP
jgi:hypothetical protein